MKDWKTLNKIDFSRKLCHHPKSENEDGWSFLCGGFDNRLDNRRQTVIVDFLFNQTSWFHACKYHATLPGVINFTVAALPPLVLLGPCDSPPSALQCASGHVSCLEIKMAGLS